MLARVIRAMSAMKISDSVSAGSVRCSIARQKPCFIGTYPCTGNHPSEIAKTYTSTKPSQKTGMENPDTAKIITPRSRSEPRFQAATTPSGTPSRTLISIA